MWSDMLALYSIGSPIPYVMLAFVCVGYIIIFERFFMIKLIYQIPFDHFNTQVRRMVLVQDYTRARQLCRATAKTGLPLIALKTIDAMEYNRYHTSHTLQEEFVHFSGRIWRRIDQLPYFAAAVLILSSLCSIQGLWQALSAVRSLDLSLKSFLFAEASLQSLLPLFLGLFFVFCLLVPYGFLMGMANRLENEIEHSVCMLSNLLSVTEPNVPTPEQTTATASDPLSKAPETPESKDKPPAPVTTPQTQPPVEAPNPSLKEQPAQEATANESAKSPEPAPPSNAPPAAAQPDAPPQEKPAPKDEEEII